MTLKLLTEHHLEFLSLKGGCTSSSESTLVKIPHCWKSHVMAHICYLFDRDYEDIRCEEADKVILERVKAGEQINLPNGKLLERLLTIKIYRESKLIRVGGTPIGEGGGGTPILERVKAGEQINLPNGKLLERLLTIKIYRESKLIRVGGTPIGEGGGYSNT